MFRNILVSIDGSSSAERALNEAIDIAIVERSRLTLLTAVRHCPSWAYSPMTAAAVQQLSADLEKEAKQVMRDAVVRVPHEIPVTKILTHKPVRQALMEQIRAGNFDLLVMGSRSRPARKAPLLGSVSRYALDHSPIPVLIVHPPENEKLERTIQGAARQPPVPGGEGAEANATA
jgi:nucleotide-binding universal stress UspA family protein